jgi:hypothetical protein
MTVGDGMGILLLWFLAAYIGAYLPFPTLVISLVGLAVPLGGVPNCVDAANRMGTLRPLTRPAGAPPPRPAGRGHGKGERMTQEGASGIGIRVGSSDEPHEGAAEVHEG